MKVELIRVTTDALDLLIDTKQTRLRGDKKAANMTDDERHEHFSYMLDTIKSSFEFVDYIFEISEVSKNFTHQLVRTRTGSYAQEAGRAVDLTGNMAVMPMGLTPDQEAKVSEAYIEADRHYQELLAMGVARQDARAVLPSNSNTKIKAKFNLRTLSDTAKLRLCYRVQGEYQNVFRDMRALVLGVHPWAEPMLQAHCAATGTCAFPRWGKTDCPQYDPRMDLDHLKAEYRKTFWARTELTQADPKAAGGMAM